MVALCAPTRTNIVGISGKYRYAILFLGSIIAIGAAGAARITVHNKAAQPSAFHKGAEFGWYGTYDAFVLEQRKLLKTQEAPEFRDNAREFVAFKTNLGEGGERTIIGIQLALEGIYLGRKYLK